MDDPRPPREFFGLGDKPAKSGQYDEFRERELLQFEDSVVAHLLRHYKLTAVKPQLQKLSEENTGDRWLTSAAFAEMFPDFPAYLVVRQVQHVIKKSPVHLFWNDFDNLPFIKPYRAAQAAHSDRPGVALVFSWPYLTAKVGEQPKGPGVIVHDLELPQVSGARISHVDDETGRWTYLEPLVNFLAALDSAGDGWKGDYVYGDA